MVTTRSNYFLFLKCGFVISFVIGSDIGRKYQPIWVSVLVLDLNQISGFGRTLCGTNSDTSWFNDSLSSSSKDASTIIMLIRLMLHLSVMNTNKVILRHSFGFGYQLHEYVSDVFLFLNLFCRQSSCLWHKNNQFRTLEPILFFMIFIFSFWPYLVWRLSSFYYIRETIRGNTVHIWKKNPEQN